MLELSTIGIRFKYKAETTAGTKPTGAFTEIDNIISIGEINGQPDQLEVTNLIDQWKRYISGVKDSGGDIQIGANLTAAFRTAWETLVTAYATAFAAGKSMWFEVVVPNLGSFFFTGEPVDLGLPGIEVNQVLQVNAHIIPNSISGWGASSGA